MNLLNLVKLMVSYILIFSLVSFPVLAESKTMYLGGNLLGKKKMEKVLPKVIMFGEGTNLRKSIYQEYFRNPILAECAINLIEENKSGMLEVNFDGGVIVSNDESTFDVMQVSCSDGTTLAVQPIGFTLNADQALDLFKDNENILSQLRQLVVKDAKAPIPIAVAVGVAIGAFGTGVLVGTVGTIIVFTVNKSSQKIVGDSILEGVDFNDVWCNNNPDCFMIAE